MRSANTTASLVCSRSTGPSSPRLPLAGGGAPAFGSAPAPLVACSTFTRAGARAPGRSLISRSLNSSALMLGTGHLRLAPEVVDRDLGGDADGFVGRLELDRIVHNRELAYQLGMLDLASGLLAGQRRAVG